MSDSIVLPQVINEHQELFRKQTLKSITTNKNYFSRSNEIILQKSGVEEIRLQRPDRVLNCTRSNLCFQAQE